MERTPQIWDVICTKGVLLKVMGLRVLVWVFKKLRILIAGGKEVFKWKQDNKVLISLVEDVLMLRYHLPHSNTVSQNNLDVKTDLQTCEPVVVAEGTITRESRSHG